MVHTTPSAGAAGTRRLRGRVAGGTGGSRQPWGAQGSRSSTAGKGTRTRTRVRASCPCCSLPPGLRFFLGSQAKVVDVPGGRPGASHAAVATSLPEPQVATSSAPLPVDSKREGGSAEGLLVLGCALARQQAGHAALPAGTGDARADRQEPTAPHFPRRVLPGGFCPAARCLRRILGQCVRARQPCSHSWPRAHAYLQRVW